jgi:hypothetical protein
MLLQACSRSLIDSAFTIFIRLLAAHPASGVAKPRRPVQASDHIASSVKLGREAFPLGNTTAATAETAIIKGMRPSSTNALEPAGLAAAKEVPPQLVLFITEYYR